MPKMPARNVAGLRCQVPVCLRPGNARWPELKERPKARILAAFAARRPLGTQPPSAGEPAVEIYVLQQSMSGLEERQLSAGNARSEETTWS